MISQNFPFSTKTGVDEGIMITAVTTVGSGIEWHEIRPVQQQRLIYDDTGRIEATIVFKGSVNTFLFTKDSVTRLKHVGALLDLCWVDFVELAEGEAQPKLSPQGVKVVGAPWILAHPEEEHDVGREADWVFEDQTMSLVKEQWREDAVERFIEENQGGPRYWADVVGIGLFVVEEEKHVNKCFGLFQGVPPQIRFWSDNYSAVTWGSIRFRRHTLRWSGEIDGKDGSVSLMVKIPGVEVELLVEMNAAVLGGDANRLRKGSVAVAGDRGLNPRDYIRAIAEIESRSYHVYKNDYKPPYPTPRTNKRSIFKR